nr:MAG TPA: hypothetical protein [Crassvirales sp.]
MRLKTTLKYISITRWKSKQYKVSIMNSIA